MATQVFSEILEDVQKWYPSFDCGSLLPGLEIASVITANDRSIVESHAILNSRNEYLFFDVLPKISRGRIERAFSVLRTCFGDRETYLNEKEGRITMQADEPSQPPEFSFKRGLLATMKAQGIEVYSAAQRTVFEQWHECVLYSTNGKRKLGLTTAFAIQSLQGIDSFKQRPQCLILTSKGESADKVRTAIEQLQHGVSVPVKYTQYSSPRSLEEEMRPGRLIVAYPLSVDVLAVFLSICHPTCEKRIIFYDIDEQDADRFQLQLSPEHLNIFDKAKVTISCSNQDKGKKFAKMIFGDRPYRLTTFVIHPVLHWKSDITRSNVKTSLEQYLRYFLKQNDISVVVYYAASTAVGRLIKGLIDEANGIFELHKNMPKGERKETIASFLKRSEKAPRSVLVSPKEYAYDIEPGDAKLGVIIYDEIPIQFYRDCAGPLTRHTESREKVISRFRFRRFFPFSFSSPVKRTVVTFLQSDKTDFESDLAEFLEIRLCSPQLDDVNTYLVR